MVASEDCYILPEPSTSSISGVRLEFPGGTLSLLFDYDRDGEVYNGGLVFKKVRSHSHTAESHCPAWKIEISYDKLVKLSDSEVIKELLENTSKDQQNSWSLNHYMIYFDSDGCYEIIAESWEALPEKEGSLS
jgi:hypothetical protein